MPTGMHKVMPFSDQHVRSLIVEERALYTGVAPQTVLNKEYMLPTIEKDGSVGELNAKIEKAGYYARPKINSKGRATNSEVSASDEVLHDIFKIQTLAFKIDDERRALLKILIHTEFKKEITDKKLRNQAIQEHLNKLAPWLFTYGERV